MAIDLFELRDYTEAADIDDLRLVHITEAGGGPGWGLMRRAGAGLDHWLSLEASSEDDAVKIIEAVGLRPAGDDRSSGSDEQDAVFILEPGSEETPHETPI